uniref:KIB1-4 beta-propeller domain-containing protein n=1 Tax=Brassica campestris TaxID=3711 RepID=M4DB42_BRACM
MTISSSLKRSCSSPDLRPSSKRTIPQSSGSPGVMLFPKDGGCVLYNPKEGTFQRKLGDFSGCRFLANSGNWLLLLDSGSNLYIVDAFSEKKMRLPSLESIDSADCIVKCVGDRKFIRQDSDSIFSDLSADAARGLLWVSESGKEYVVVWLFDLPGHSYMSFCKNGDTHYTDIPLFHHQDLHWLDGLSEMVLWGTRLYLSTNRRYVRVLDLSGPQGFFKDITDGIPFPMLSADMSCDSSIAVTTSGQVLLVESDPCNRTCFRLYKKNPDIENPDLFGHTVTEVDSLNGEALLLDLGYTVPANRALGIEPDSIYFTRHYRPCQCASPDLDICVFNLATKSLDRYPDLDKMDLIDARWFLPSGN